MFRLLVYLNAEVDNVIPEPMSYESLVSSTVSVLPF